MSTDETRNDQQQAQEESASQDEQVKETKEAAQSEQASGESAAETPQEGSAGELEALRSQLAEQKEQVLRAKAEMQNVRRRSELDVQKAHKFGTEKLIKEILPVVDSLEKAIESTRDEEVANEEVVTRIREGVDMTLNLLLSNLEKFNVKQINPVGEPFDPQLHEAMSMVPSREAEPNSVIAVMQKGYTLNDRLVRPAMVMVARAPEPEGGNVDEKA
ncbi:MAG: nucleotide exchange factor GrpE [Oleiphilaceae bacterium]|nr:nucleotide exchange factor GrpE [Oleiphilaceae bacterium]